MISEFSLTQWLIFGAVAVSVGIAKTGFGGFGMIAVVVMAFMLPARESTGALLTLLIVGDVIAVQFFGTHCKWNVLGPLILPALVGIVCGVVVMQSIPDETFRPTIGWVTLALLALVVIQRASGTLFDRAAQNPALALIAGWAGGVTTMIANAAGPTMTIYLLSKRLPKMEFVGTAAWFFLGINLAKMPFSFALGLISGQSLLLTVLLIPGVMVGALLGRWALGKINQVLFEFLLIAFAALAAIRLVF